LIDFGRYVSQTEQCINESNGINEWTPPPPSSTINDIPPIISVPTTTSPTLSTNIPQKITIPSSIINDE
jgi:hypothetical protein